MSTTEKPQSIDAPGGETQPQYVVVIGASAGGLEALEELFLAMTQRMGIAFVVVQHLLPDVEHHMVELVSRWTSLTVELSEHGKPLAADTIYLLPPDIELSVADGCFVLVARPPGPVRPIDVCMRSCAAEYGEHSIAVVLSGSGDDGSQGVRDIHAAGGLVLVQREETAKFDSMPRSTLATGVVDIAVSPREVPEVLRRHISGRKLADVSNHVNAPTQANGTATVFALLQAQYGINFAFYKPGTITRRIDRRIQLQQHHDLTDYIKRLQSDHAELDALYRDLLIGVTSFFRDAKAFERLENEVVPQLIAAATHGPDVRIWIAGCATGEEAYSIAMLLCEASERSVHPINVRIFATDVHRPSLDFAGVGLYPTAAVAEIGEARLARFFVHEAEGYRVTNDLRRVIVFAQHNVMSDAPFTKLDLISCRNLLIYVQPAMQRRILSLFHFGLRTNGVLFLGPSETPGDVVDEFEVIDHQWRVYRKRRDVRLLPVPREVAALSPIGTSTASRDSHLVDLFSTLLDTALPPSVLINHEYQILHTFGDVRPFLRLPRGRPSLGLLDLLEPGFKLAVAGALHRAARARTPVSFSDVRGGALEPAPIDIRVRPIEPAGSSSLFYLVSLTPAAETNLTALPDTLIDLDQATRDHIDALELELRQAKESLQGTIEELEVSNEELQATNEELLASNEELNSLNQELHSVNEELHTVNSEFQQKIDQLTELSDDMDNLLLSTEVHTLFLDDKLAIRKFTPAMAEVFHLVGSDVGRRIDGFTYNLDSPGLVELLDRVRASGQRYEGGVHHQGFSYLMRVLPYLGRGRRAGVVLTLVDVTRLERVELALRHQVEQRDRFLTVLSHELRNPLAAVNNALQLLARRLDHAEDSITDPIGIIARQSTHMQRLLDDLLDVARMTQGKFQLCKATLDLRVLLSEVVETNRAGLGEQQPRLALEQRDSEPLWVFGDSTRLTQIFDNLLINAIKYTPNGGHITIALDRDAQRAVVHIRDDGLGMDPQTRARVFELFMQADASLDRSQGGLGVGLTLVRNLVELHDGQVEVHSEGLGLGSDFVLRFPLVPAPARPPAPIAEPIEQPATGHERRLVVVEDRPEILAPFRDLLSECGFEVSTARDGLHGLEMILAQPPDAALLDIGLPGIDGYEIARRLRADPTTASLPLIAITGYGREEDVTKAREAGFNAHLVKPINVDDLILLLARYGVRSHRARPIF
jgi:two-component system CheB/CheR fusion protein